jgi:hypothetical protein
MILNSIKTNSDKPRSLNLNTIMDSNMKQGNTFDPLNQRWLDKVPDAKETKLPENPDKLLKQIETSIKDYKKDETKLMPMLKLAKAVEVDAIKKGNLFQAGENKYRSIAVPIAPGKGLFINHYDVIDGFKCVNIATYNQQNGTTLSGPDGHFYVDNNRLKTINDDKFQSYNAQVCQELNVDVNETENLGLGLNGFLKNSLNAKPKNTAQFDI